MKKIESEEYKLIIKRIRNYKKYKREIEELKLNVIESSPLPQDGQPKGNKVGNPTETKVIQIAGEERLNLLVKICSDMEMVYSSLDDEHKLVWNKAIISRRQIDTLEYELGMSRNTIYRKRRSIVNTLADLWGLR